MPAVIESRFRDQGREGPIIEVHHVDGASTAVALTISERTATMK